MKNFSDPFVDTPESFHTVIEDTLMKLEENPMKRKIKWPALAVAAVFIMVAATGFAAAGLVRGIVDWDGNLTPVINPAGPNPTPTPWPVSATESDITEKMHDLIAPVPEMEYWIAFTQSHGSGKYGQYAPVYNDKEAFSSAIQGLDDLEISFPEGYTLLNGEIFYDPVRLVGEMYSEEAYGSVTLQKYHLNPPTAEEWEGYGLTIAGEGDATISLHVFVYPSFDEAIRVTGTFYVDEEDKYDVIALPGFERALLFERGDGATLIELIHTAEDGRAFSISLYGSNGPGKEELLNMIGTKNQ